MHQSPKQSTKSAKFQDIIATFPKKKPAQPVSNEDIKKAVAEGAVKRFKKAVS